MTSKRQKLRLLAEAATARIPPQDDLLDPPMAQAGFLIEAVARLFAQDLPPAEFHRRIGRNPTTIDGDVTLVPHDAPLTSIIAWSTTYQLTLRLRVPMPPAKMETRFGPFEVWRADNRENPSFNVMLTGSHAAFAVHLELMFPDPVGADWRDGPIDEVHLFRSPARHE